MSVDSSWGGVPGVAVETVASLYIRGGFSVTAEVYAGSKFQDKLNAQKSVVLLYASKKQFKGEIRKTNT